MSDQEKSIRADAKLKSMPPEALDRLWDWRHPAEESIRPLTYAEILELLPGEFGLSSSLASLSEFYSWLRQRRRMERAQARAEQAKLEWLRENPEASPEDLAGLAQMVFTSETLESGNIKAFVALRKLQLQTRQLEHEGRRIRLLEEKERRAEQAKKDLEAAATKARDGGVSEETIAAIEAAAGLL